MSRRLEMDKYRRQLWKNYYKGEIDYKRYDTMLLCDYDSTSVFFLFQIWTTTLFSYDYIYEHMSVCISNLCVCVCTYIYTHIYTCVYIYIYRYIDIYIFLI